MSMTDISKIVFKFTEEPFAPVTNVSVTDVPVTNVHQKRCFCKKKLALSDMACSKCDRRFCGAHRQPELHECPHDFKKEGRDLLTKQNPKIVATKIDSI